VDDSTILDKIGGEVDLDFMETETKSEATVPRHGMSASKLYDVLESRLGKWTVLTANVSLSQIGELLDPRIASRMIRNNSVVVDVNLPDWNLRDISNPLTADADTATT
jgi:hypothetical protein